MAVSENPRIPFWISTIYRISGLVLLWVSTGLFFLPASMTSIWPWELLPFHTRFLGAVYLAAFAILVVIGIRDRWSPGRLAYTMILVFTAVILAASLLNLEHFDLDRWPPYVWFTVYFIFFLTSANTVWSNRERAPADAIPLAPLWRNYLLAQGLILFLYGLALFFIPSLASAFWPWGIDAFHGQVYSTIFLTLAVGSIIASRSVSAMELFTLGLAQLVLGFFVIAGLVIVDLAVQRVNWSAPGTWLWIGGFAILGLAGLGLAVGSRWVQRSFEPATTKG